MTTARWFPNKELTPALCIAAVLCVRGYAKAHRVWRDKAGTLAKYGIARDRASDDDLIPVCLGGNNASPPNHLPQLTAVTFKPQLTAVTFKH
jgi:hypothetical protein